MSALTLDQAEAQGRMIAAGRKLAGLDQAQLATAAGLSPATVSNVERGQEARSETLRALRKALRDSGVALMWDSRNCLVSVTAAFEERDSFEDS